MPSDSNSPNVVISGAGPSGLLSAILFAELGVKSTVIEKSKEPDQWSTKSYTIVIEERGQEALRRGNCLEAAKELAIARTFIYFVDAVTGERKCIPKKFPGLGFSRPLLVECLETIATTKYPNMITIKRGVGVKVVRNATSTTSNKEPNGNLEVHLDDDSNTVLSATHVIGADGKWSKVRSSYPSLSSQASIERCNTFGVYIMANLPEGWAGDGTYVIRPSPECSFIIIASPVGIHTEDFCISMVCSEKTVEKYPFLAPPNDLEPDQYGHGGWQDEYSALPTNESENESPLSEQISELFQKEVPAVYNAIGKDAFKSARVNRYVSWLHMKGDIGDVNYTTTDGKITLIGDAAHAVTPSMGEGCNTAMESAVKLIDEVLAIMKDKEDDTNECTKEIISEAFVNYGKSRPKEVIPIQEKSAAASNSTV